MSKQLQADWEAEQGIPAGSVKIENHHILVKEAYRMPNGSKFIILKDQSEDGWLSYAATIRVQNRSMKKSVPVKHWLYNEASKVHVLYVAGSEVGFICKPPDTKTDKNAWRIHKGIGEGNEFLGHEWTMHEAKKILESWF